MLSKQGITLNLKLLSAVMMFWDNTTNTFNFRMGPMTPTILDMAQLFGLRPSSKCVDITKDWAAHRETNKKKKRNVGAILPLVKMNSDPTELKASGTSFSGFLHYFKGRSSSNSLRANPDQDHIHFLLYWLNKFLFPNPSKCIKLERIPLAEALNAYEDIVMGPFVLSHLYSMLDKMIKDRPFQTNRQGPLWMVQIWLKWYFPELRSPEIIFEDRTVLAIQLALAPLTHRTTLECLYLFRECRTRTTEQWDASFVTAYPWFEKEIFLEELDGPDDKWGTVRFFSCVQVRDIAWGVRSEYPYNHGMTVCSWGVRSEYPYNHGMAVCLARTTAIGWPLRRPLVTTVPNDRACGGAYPPPLASRGFLSRTPFSLSRILSLKARVFVNRGLYIGFWADYWA
ncbi:hypothetical protein C1H46_025900 [Malus baccata]|uniref:Aminotransferase-like plant mobile domain-containing protein n=1 Tax=Malus baccata TaxID=106549 RepID=A0A540LQ07_MALBA|nr:hypothetical protein C1H46_025900 [Malus baccata]